MMASALGVFPSTAIRRTVPRSTRSPSKVTSPLTLARPLPEQPGKVDARSKSSVAAGGQEDRSRRAGVVLLRAIRLGTIRIIC
jgi:hypothetical protein